MILAVLGHMANQTEYLGCGVRKRGLLVTWLGEGAPSSHPVLACVASLRPQKAWWRLLVPEIM